MVLHESKCEITGIADWPDPSHDVPTYWTYPDGNIIYFLDLNGQFGIIRFATPGFVDGARYVRFTLGVYKSWCFDHGVCAICKSDSNWKKYELNESWTNNVVDDNQIAKCNFTLSDHSPTSGTGLKKITLDVPVESLEPNTTYYLFVWRDVSEYLEPADRSILNLGPTSSHSVSVFCQVGLINIDTGSSLETYQCYIDNGTSWDMVVPYIDNGSSWDMYT